MTAEHRAPLRYVVATGVLAVAGTLWFAVWAITGAGPAAVSFLAMPLGAAITAAAVLDLLRRARSPRRRAGSGGCCWSRSPPSASATRCSPSRASPTRPSCR
jgi:hypothetical protein